MAVKVISSKDLQDTHASNLQEALSRLTTNVTTHTNGMGTFVNVNGVSDDYVVILENGKRISGDDRWNRINMANVKRVEIFSGAKPVPSTAASHRRGHQYRHRRRQP